ncbi:MAG TPA: hypothetical protein VE713_04950, partial [Pyrinomonadaceae bacterium]|nr:hypothetical protein [Pyrinomonadaceae bacterium]
LEAGFWAKVRGANDLTAVKTAYQQFFGDDPELGKNVIAEALRNSDRLRAINPKLPSFLGELANIVLEPSNVVLIGGTALGAKLLRGSAAAARAGEAARGLGLLGRGFVEARPLGLGDAALGSAASDAGEPLHVLLRGTDGTNYLAHTGTGDVINLETGELVYEGGKPVAESGAVNSAELPGVGRPPLTEGEIAQKAREVGMPVEEVRQEALRQGYRVAPGDAPPEQPLHEYLEELTGRPAPELQPVPQPPPSLGSRVVNISSDIINAPKSIKSSLALHGPFRQGVFQAAAHPTFLQDAITQQVKAFASEDAYRAFAQSLTEKPWYQPMQDAGLFLPSTYDVEMGGRAPAWMREERFASAAAEKIPGVRASSRAYVGAMDSIRSQAVEHYLTTLYGPEMDLSKADPETLKALAEFVNLSTGRGTVPILDRFASGRQAVAAANNLLWSPRAMASRFNLVSPYRLVMNAANPATRPVAALQAADSMRTALSVGATLSLLALVPGVKVGLNPFKSGWGMVRVGNTEYDILDGVPSTVKAAAQVGQLLYRHAEGKSPARGRSVYGLTSDFPHRRLSPSAQVAAEALTGKNAMGDKVSGSQMASDLLTPFTLEEMYKAWIDAGGSSVGDTLQGKEFKTGFKGAAKGLPSAVGVPTRTYKEQNQGGPREEIRRAVEGADL